jgi:hypothetical protein
MDKALEVLAVGELAIAAGCAQQAPDQGMKGIPYHNVPFSD